MFTKEQIYHYVWNEEYYGDENVINVHMRRLREKIEVIHLSPNILKHYGALDINWRECRWRLFYHHYYSFN